MDSRVTDVQVLELELVIHDTDYEIIVINVPAHRQVHFTTTKDEQNNVLDDISPLCINME